MNDEVNAIIEKSISNRMIRIFRKMKIKLIDTKYLGKGKIEFKATYYNPKIKRTEVKLNRVIKGGKIK